MDDLISRQTVINMLNDINAEVNDGCGYMYEHWMDYIKQLPSVTPEYLSVCDMCMYGNPSSTEGKPCTMCPALTKVGEING